MQKKGPGAVPNLQSTELSETKAESDVESNYTEQEDDETSDLMPEQMIATDTQDATGPIACFALFRKKMESMEETAKQICKNENNTRVRCQDGSYVKVPDAGGRHVAEKILQDVHSAARHFDNNMQQKLDSIAGKLDEPTV